MKGWEQEGRGKRGEGKVSEGNGGERKGEKREMRGSKRDLEGEGSHFRVNDREGFEGAFEAGLGAAEGDCQVTKVSSE